MNIDLGNIGLSAIRKVTDLWNAGKADSLIDYTRVARVEPIVLIDASCLFMDMLPMVQQSLLNIFAGYYLQAVAISTTVGKVDVMRQLDKLNPNRSPMDSAVDTGGWLLASESYKYRLPRLDNSPAMETEKLTTDKTRLSFEKPHDTGGQSFNAGRDTPSTLRELADLSVGKLLNVEITDGLHRATIPLSVRLMASSLPTESLVHILSLGADDNSVKERWHKWRSGQIEFVKDLIFCQDLISAHRKNLMHDKDGIYSNLVKRARQNGLSTIFSGNPSVATASNIAIISSQTAEQLELKINGKLDNFKTRESVFKETYLMIMAVVDNEWKRVTFYHRGINGHTEVGERDLKAANRSGGPDVTDILRAYQLGTSPSL